MYIIHQLCTFFVWRKWLVEKMTNLRYGEITRIKYYEDKCEYLVQSHVQFVAYGQAINKALLSLAHGIDALILNLIQLLTYELASIGLICFDFLGTDS